ncbi:MAG: hypothetical protein R3B47_06685 [Bacteroidia bacterium]
MQSALSIEQLRIDGNRVHGRLRFYSHTPCGLEELWLALVQKPVEGGRSYWGTQKIRLGYNSDETTGWLIPFSFTFDAPEQQLPLGELRLPREEQEARKKARDSMAMTAGPFSFEAMLMTDIDERAILVREIDLKAHFE